MNNFDCVYEVHERMGRGIPDNVMRYSSMAMCAMDIRVTYPRLVHQLRKSDRVQITPKYTVRRITRSRLKVNEALTIQTMNLDTSEIAYYPTMAAAAESHGYNPKLVQNRFRYTKSFITLGRIRFYKLV